MADSGGRGSGDNQLGGVNSLGDSRSGVELAGMAARPAETEVSDDQTGEIDSGKIVDGDSGYLGNRDRRRIPASISAASKHAAGQGVGDGGTVDTQMPQSTASIRNATNSNFVADGIWGKSQMPQMQANATNATTQDLESVDFSVVAFAEPTGWGKLWRIERNGNYFIYRLRFVDSKDTPKEYRRITRKGGKLTPKIEAKLEERKGRGRHAESRTDADRFRSRAFDLAKRIRASR